MVTGQISSLRRRRRRRKALIAAICALVVLTASFFVLRFLTRKETFEISPDATVTTAAGRVYALENGILCGYTAHGRQTFEAEVPDSNAVEARTRYVLAYGDEQMYLLGAKGSQKATIRTDGKIERVDCGEETFAVLLRDDVSQGVIHVLDPEGNRLDEVSTSELLEGDILTKMGVFGETLWVSALNTSGAMPVSRIYLYNVREQTILARISIPNQIVYDVAMDEKSVIAIGTKQILCYNRTGTLQWQKPSSGLFEVRKETVKGTAAIVLTDQTHHTYRTIHNYSDYTVAPDATALFCQNARMYYLTGETLIAYRVADYMKVKHTVLERTCLDARALRGRRVLLFDGEYWISQVI